MLLRPPPPSTKTDRYPVIEYKNVNIDTPGRQLQQFCSIRSSINNPPRTIINKIGGHSDTKSANTCLAYPPHLHPPTPRLPRTSHPSLGAVCGPPPLPRNNAGPGRKIDNNTDISTFDRVEAGRAGDVTPVLRLVQHLGDGAREAAARQQAVRAVRPLVSRAAPR